MKALSAFALQTVSTSLATGSTLVTEGTSQPALVVLLSLQTASMCQRTALPLDLDLRRSKVVNISSASAKLLSMLP